jgi:hypothetical protein
MSQKNSNWCRPSADHTRTYGSWWLEGLEARQEQTACIIDAWNGRLALFFPSDSVILIDVDEPVELQNNPHWRTAVWALRVGYLALAVAIVGVVLVVTGSTPWVLAAGVVVWLAMAAVTLTGVFRARSQLPEPRPGLWPIRFMLINDTIHARSVAGRS